MSIRLVLESEALDIQSKGQDPQDAFDVVCDSTTEQEWRSQLLSATTTEQRIDMIIEHALQGEPPELLSIKDGRVALCETNPLLWALVYFPHHLASKDTGGQISFSKIHLELCDIALSWMNEQTLESNRDAVVAPRGSGKSTWLFLILPCWALAYGHVSFIAAFADAATQAEEHLATMRRELTDNALLRNDFPEFCTPLTHDGSYEAGSDTTSSLMQSNGAVIKAKGVDRPVRGLKVGSRRPDLLLLDDVEKGEAQYSSTIIAKRLETIKTDILMLELAARVVLAGTTTRSDSIIHQLVQSVRTTSEPEAWITDLKFNVHYYPALDSDEDGNQFSIWPQRWSTEWLVDNIHRDDILQELQNDPQTYNPSGWHAHDFRYGSLPAYDRTILSIDGAVTARTKSDQTGLAVVSGSVVKRRCFVHEAVGVRLAGEALRTKVLDLLTRYPEIVYILVETNQGGDLWFTVLHDMPVKVVPVHQSEPKEYRIKRLQTHYQRGGGAVTHVKALPQLESQMKSWPKVQHDDIIDAAATGEWHLCNVLFNKKPGPSARRVAY